MKKFINNHLVLSMAVIIILTVVLTLGTLIVSRMILFHCVSAYACLIMPCQATDKVQTNREYKQPYVKQHLNSLHNRR